MMTDTLARQQALDCTQSYIVQAPAGSGKTELLTQRYLKLLCTVTQPEHIIAITFTRKAAAEMRQRILDALQLANAAKPEEAHKAFTWSLAKNAMEHNTHQQWNILSNPNRLRILTIDSLATRLCQQMPLLAKIAPKIKILEDPQDIYQQAISSLLLHAKTDKPLYHALQTILLQVDNRIDQLDILFSSLLAKRDQWLHYLMPYFKESDALKRILENSLNTVVQESIARVQKNLDMNTLTQLKTLAIVSAQNLNNKDIESALEHCKITQSRTEDIRAWQYITQLLLTKTIALEKPLINGPGFPQHIKKKRSNSYNY